MIAHVISTHVEGLSGGTSGAVDTSGATLLVAAVAYNSGGTPTVSDSKSNPWTGLSAQDSGGGGAALRIFYVENPTVGSGHTFTVAGGTLAQALAVAAYSGVVTTSPFEDQTGNTATGTVTSLSPGSITPAENNEVVIAALSLNSGSNTPTASGYTVRQQIDFTGGSNYGVTLADQIQTTATATNPAWSWATSTNGAATATATFKSAVVSGPVIPLIVHHRKQQMIS